MKHLKKTHGKKSLGEVTVEMAIGGMRGIPVSLMHVHTPDIDVIILRNSTEIYVVCCYVTKHGFCHCQLPAAKDLHIICCEGSGCEDNSCFTTTLNWMNAALATVCGVAGNAVGNFPAGP